MRRGAAPCRLLWHTRLGSLGGLDRRLDLLWLAAGFLVVAHLHRIFAGMQGFLMLRAVTAGNFILRALKIPGRFDDIDPLGTGGRD